MAKKSSSRSGAGARGERGSSAALRIVWLNRVRTLYSEKARKDLEAALRGAYAETKGLTAIVVCDKLVGYSATNRPQVLAIELVHEDRSRPKIVRIDDEAGTHRAAMEKEYAGWTKLKGYLGDPDPLFMSLSDLTQDGRRKVLEYDAASTALVTRDVALLEDVVLRSCRWGSPTPESVAQRIRNVYDYMNHRLFIHARAKNSAEVAEYYREKLEGCVKKWWRPERVARRRPVLLSIEGKPHKFQDPVDWINWVLSPVAENCVPECIFGPCHGDMHGRNVLIGLSNGEAGDQAVYDFEDMDLDLPVAWEFVKLEMELRVRVLPYVIRAMEDGKKDFRHAMEFEQQLYHWTRNLDNQTLRPIKTHRIAFDRDYPDQWKRLFAVLLEIRQTAKVCLSGRERPECWKEEYLFTVAAYAVHTAKHAPYDSIHQQLAYIAGGVAAAHFAREDCYCPRICCRKICREDAEWDPKPDLMPNAEQEPFGAKGEPLFPNYAVVLADPRKRAQARVEETVEEAMTDLEHLHEMYPHVVAVEQEWALAKVELSTLVADETRSAELRKEADEILLPLLRQFQSVDEETLGKLGRRHKECAWALNDYGQRETTADRIHYQRALQYYQRAYGLRKGYYPGINVATLLFLLCSKNEAASVAREVLDTCSVIKPEDLQEVDERIWVEATRAEAYLLLEEYESALECYSAAMSLDPTEAYADSPRRHARCILAKLPAGDESQQVSRRKICRVLEIRVPDVPQGCGGFLEDRFGV
ncbi:MAG TPA: TRAFs-binding domain-containing protein [Thermoguttaceae bacterium]|nr:TRAFs-binding domain-containing protein [Thermoguttaceae bacterium]